MPVLTYPSGPLEANCHIYYNDKDAIIMDPAEETAEMLDKLKSLGVQLQAILLTHLHFDHAYGCANLQKETGLPVYAGQKDIDMAEVLLYSAQRFGLPTVQDFSMEALSEGTHKFGSITCKAIAVPGHSQGSLAYYIPEEKVIFTGDVLFYRSIGRSDLPGGNHTTLCTNIREKLFTLPSDTTAYCGHGMETNIGDEARMNPHCSL